MQEEKKPVEQKKNIKTAKAATKKRQKGQPSPKKKKKRISAGVLVSIVFVIAIAGVFAMVYFDIGGTKQSVIEMFSLDIPPDEQIVSAHQMVEEALTKQEELELQIETLDQQLDDWEDREDELIDKQEDLADKEQELAELEETISGDDSETEGEDDVLTATVKIFEEMDTAKAAEAIVGMETIQERVTLLINMTSDKAALILDQMDSELATKILSEMIN